MDFNSYIQARMFFQQKKEALKTDQLDDLILALVRMRKEITFELEDIEDLILDVEVEAERRSLGIVWRELPVKENLLPVEVPGMIAQTPIKRGRGRPPKPKVVSEVENKKQELPSESNPKTYLHGPVAVKILDFEEGNLLEAAEVAIIRACLEKFEGNLAATARALCMTYQPLKIRVLRHGINVSDYRNKSSKR